MRNLLSRRSTEIINSRPKRHPRSRSRAAYFEALECRVLLSTVTVIANTNDQGVTSASTFPWIGDPTIRSGDSGNNSSEEAAVFPFQLPTLPAGAVITSAVLTMNLSSLGNPTSIVGPDDLYGEHFRTTSTVATTDFFEGAYGTSTDTALQQTFATKTTAVGAVSTTSTGDANLVSYLSGQYAAGGTGNYVFLRLNAESDQLTARYWVWSSANAVTGLQPSLQFTYSTTVAPPSNLVTVTNPGTAINLTWTNNAISSTNVVVQRSTDGTTYSTIATLASSATSYLDNTGLSADSLYYYRVYAENGGTNSAYSNVASDSTLPTFSYQTVWVDGTNGTDTTTSGAFTTPFKTITYALNSTAVKAHPAGTGIVVRAGTYTEANKTLVMPSGASGSPFTLMGEPTERVVISGFKQITGWTLVSGGIYSTITTFNPDTLYVNNTPQAISRSPDSSWWIIPATFTQNSDGTTTITDPAHLAGIGNVVGGYMQEYSTAANIPYSAKILSQDTTAGSITFTGLGAVATGQYYSLTDAQSLINNPGEWASVDNGNGTFTVYFQPNSVADLSSTQARNTAGREIQVNSTGHDVTIRNLEITGSAGWGIDIEGSQTTLAANVTVRNDLIHNNGKEGVWIRFTTNITVENNTIQANLNGIGIASTTNSLVTANDIGYNTTDGIDLTGDWRGPGVAGFTPTVNVTISNNYIHDHLGWGHADGIQIFSWVDSATITGNFLYNNGQDLMSENVDDDVTNNVADSDWSTFSNNMVYDSGAYTVIFGHGNSFNWNVTNNTIGGTGYGPFSFTATGYNVSQNIIVGKEGMTSAAANIYTGDYNFYYSPTTQYFQSTSSPTWVNYNAITNAGHTGFYDKQGQDQHSQFLAASSTGVLPSTTPFVNGPVFGTMSVGSVARNWEQSTTTTIYLVSVAEMKVGDYIQIDNDGVVRKITNVDTTNNAITFDVPVAAPLLAPNALVEDWGANSNFLLNLAAAGVAATMGPTGGPVGSTLNVQNYIAGDYNGDGKRDNPAIPVDVKAGLPTPMGWRPPNFSVIGP